MQSVPPTGLVAAEVFCKLNNDCIDTTYCCSDYSCVHPEKCLHGQKVTEDTCDFNFECYSRCCDSKTCSHFLKCYKTCSANADCEASACCSEGYCTHDVVCNGNKVIGDSCDTSDECLSRFCDSVIRTCALEPLHTKEIGVLGLVGICLSAVVVLLFTIYCCQLWRASQKHNNFMAVGALSSNTNGSLSGKGRVAEKQIKRTNEDSSESDLSEEASRNE